MSLIWGLESAPTLGGYNHSNWVNYVGGPFTTPGRVLDGVLLDTGTDGGRYRAAVYVGPDSGDLRDLTLLEDLGIQIASGPGDVPTYFPSATRPAIPTTDYLWLAFKSRDGGAEANRVDRIGGSLPSGDLVSFYRYWNEDGQNVAIPHPANPIDAGAPLTNGTPRISIRHSAAGSSTERPIAFNGNADYHVIQTMPHEANTDPGVSLFSSEIITVTDNMQCVIPKVVGGVTITPSFDGTFTTDTSETITFDATYFDPGTGTWSIHTLTLEGAVAGTLTLTGPNSISDGVATAVTGSALNTITSLKLESGSAYSVTQDSAVFGGNSIPFTPDTNFGSLVAAPTVPFTDCTLHNGAVNDVVNIVVDDV